MKTAFVPCKNDAFTIKSRREIMILNLSFVAYNVHFKVEFTQKIKMDFQLTIMTIILVHLTQILTVVCDTNYKKVRTIIITKVNTIGSDEKCSFIL